MKKKNEIKKFTKHAIEVIKSKRQKINILKLNSMKKKNEPVAWVTAYDLLFSYVAERAGADMILVGDSGGMVQLGYETTNPVTMDEMIVLASSARRGATNTFIIGDMPQRLFFHLKLIRYAT